MEDEVSGGGEVGEEEGSFGFVFFCGRDSGLFILVKHNSETCLFINFINLDFRQSGKRVPPHILFPNLKLSHTVVYPVDAEHNSTTLKSRVQRDSAELITVFWVCINF